MKNHTHIVIIIMLYVCLIPFFKFESAIAESQCNLYLDIIYDSNIFTNTYDADIYLDDSFVGTIKQGKEFTFLTESNTGNHTIIFRKSEEGSVSGSKSFSIKCDSTANFTIQAHSEEIEIKKHSVTDSITGAYMNMLDVTFLDLKTAKKLLENEGYINVSEKAFDNSPIWNDDKWTIINQNIPGNSTIDKTDEIILTCKPTDAFLDENFLGLSAFDAIMTADKLGYNPEFINSVTEKAMKQNVYYMDSIEQSRWIINKTKMEDTKNRRILLSIYYDGEVMVPLVTEMSLEQAITELQMRFFSNIKFNAKDGSWISNKDTWKVIYQSEPAGEMIQASSEIVLVCISYSTEKTAIANGETITYSTPTPVTTKTLTPTATIKPINSPTPTVIEEEYVIPGLRYYAEKAIVVAFTNMDSLDVFTEDGNNYDSSKFHDYTYTGEYQHKVTDIGIWTIKSENSYHVENMYLLMDEKDWNHAIKLNADITYENHQYILSHVEFVSASPKYIDSDDPYKTSGWTHMEPNDFNSFLTVPSTLVGGEPDIMSDRMTSLTEDVSIDNSEEQPISVTEVIQKDTKVVINNPGDVGMVMYSKPSFLGDIMMTLMNGTPVTVISDPKEAEGYRWIQVLTKEGYEGWVFEAGVNAVMSKLSTPVVEIDNSKNVNQYHSLPKFKIFPRTEYLRPGRGNSAIIQGNNEKFILLIETGNPEATFDDISISYGIDEFQILNIENFPEGKFEITVYCTNEGHHEMYIASQFDLIQKGDLAKIITIQVEKLNQYDGQVVYIAPRSGEKYHSSLSHAGQNGKATTLYDAKKMGYTPCNVCFN